MLRRGYGILPFSFRLSANCLKFSVQSHPVPSNLQRLTSNQLDLDRQIRTRVTDWFAVRFPTHFPYHSPCCSLTLDQVVTQVLKGLQHHNLNAASQFLSHFTLPFNYS
uniref:Uncharacterized protein n=1 Tax=Anguilla anguilla TaxID=7936 RepID=A0A0E9XS94_ANGAN